MEEESSEENFQIKSENQSNNNELFSNKYIQTSQSPILDKFNLFSEKKIEKSNFLKNSLIFSNEVFYFFIL